MPKHVYPAGGWLPEHASLSTQRDDQGKDIVTDWRGAIQAPGNGRCLMVPSDRPFPNGFGPRYPVVEITTGPFGGHQWYLGHTTAAVSPGDTFAFGHVLSHADQGRPSMIGITVPGNGGWVELGEWVNGPRPNAPTHWYDGLLSKPLVVRTPDRPLHRGDKGPKVLMLTRRLQTLGLLPRPYWHFTTKVAGAVKLFQAQRGLKAGGIVDGRTWVAVKHAAQAHRRR